MNKFESHSREEDAIPENEQKESFSVEKWKLTRENALQVQKIVENAAQKERNPEEFLAQSDRAWASLDEKGVRDTAIDKNRTEALIKEIENRFPQLKHFASEQYC
jgi:hypothetical protein